MRAGIFLTLLICVPLWMGCEEGGPTPFESALDASYLDFRMGLAEDTLTRACIESAVPPGSGTCNCPNGGRIEVSTVGTVQTSRLIDNCRTTSGQVFNGTISENPSQPSGWNYDFNVFGECTQYLGNSPIECNGEFTVTCAGFFDTCRWTGPTSSGCEYTCGS